MPVFYRKSRLPVPFDPGTVRAFAWVSPPWFSRLVSPAATMPFRLRSSSYVLTGWSRKCTPNSISARHPMLLCYFASAEPLPSEAPSPDIQL